MRNAQSWFPTKYVLKNQVLKGSRDPQFLSISSRLMTDITASFYQRYLPLHAKGRLADLGCGNVPFYHVYKNLITENICVDWPNSMHANHYLDCEYDLNKPLPFANDHFDTIIISEVLEHISNPEMIWSEMARILKPKGKILLSVPFFYKIHEAPYDYYRYTEFALQHLATKNKLSTIELQSFGGLPEIFTDMLAKNLTRVPLAGSSFSKLVQYTCSLFLKTGFGKKISSKTGKTFPLGYFMIVEKTHIDGK
jgi:SAM-dependent methyltransferase